MSNLLQFFAFFFLVTAIGIEITTLSTSHMLQYTKNVDDHEGIFVRCVAIRGCRWWSSATFYKDPGFLKAVTVVSFLSVGTLAFVVLFSLIAFLPKCRSRNLNILNGVLMLFNAVLLSTIVTIYTTLNDKGVTFKSNMWSFSWTYWMFYASIGVNVLTSILFCCNTATTGKYKYEY